MDETKILQLVGASIGGFLLLIFTWTFISNAQLGLTLLAAKESVGFFPFIGTFFLYTLGFYFILLFILTVIGIVMIQNGNLQFKTEEPEEPQQQESLPVQ
jgi:hypothetical protein